MCNTYSDNLVQVVFKLKTLVARVLDYNVMLNGLAKHLVVYFIQVLVTILDFFIFLSLWCF